MYNTSIAMGNVEMKQNSFAIIIIGNEVLDGTVTEANAIKIINTLTSLGYTNTQIRVIPDEIKDIAKAFIELSQGNTYTLSTGGIGPTHDDKTLQAVGSAFRSPLVINKHMTEYLDNHFSNLRPAVRKQLSYLPTHAHIYENKPHWPVISMYNCFILPGIPALVDITMQRIKNIIPYQTPLSYSEFLLKCSELDIYQWLDNFQQSNPEVQIGCYPPTGNVKWQARVVLKSNNSMAHRVASTEMYGYFKTHKWLIKVKQREHIDT